MFEPTGTYAPATTRYDTMLYKRCGASGLKLPAISLGFWHNFGDITPYDQMKALVLTAFDHGITHFDLANNYGPEPGAAEKNAGRLIRQYLAAHRDELVISTKAGYEMWSGPYGDWGSRKYLLASLDQSLERLGLDYVDIFYHHRPDPETPLEETMGALAQGLLTDRYLNGIPADSRVAHDPRFLHADDVTRVHGQIMALNEIAKQRGQTLAEMSLAWLLHDDAVTSVLAGASKPQQIIDNIGALKNTDFSDEELKAIDEISMQ